MPTIKRYPNRKLYDTEAKQYVTLEGIAHLVREGQDVRVVDYATGEDLTALTLAQIMFDQEKKAGGFVPHSVLSELVKAGGKTLSALQHSLASPLGLGGQVDEEIARRIDALVMEGELTEEEGTQLHEKLTSPPAQPQERLLPSKREVERMLEKRDIPTRADLRRLTQKVEALAAKLDKVTEGEKVESTPKRSQRKRR